MKFFSKLPSSAQAVLTVMALLSPVVMVAGLSQPEMLKWFLLGYVVIGVVASLGAVIITRQHKQKAREFTEDIKDNAGSTQGVNDSELTAKEINDLGKIFQEGIKIYKDRGKDLYSLPWYVVVGEAGSGKTEAVRRSEIGFPDKLLENYWQGTGGTQSMHWWFTNRAVILDTAGKLFVNDGGATPGALKQWISFLQMLRKNRPDCPINGLVLAIPATSLMKLTDEVAEAKSLESTKSKAGQIARQMEVLRNELDVRFPVYLLITKTDRIIGFREFFERTESPEERYQMLGWSNPEPLDKPFDPRTVSAHLRETADRLRRRRMSLLKDPVPAPGHKRFAEVDSLFALPASFEGLAPKLECYLRQIFAVEAWSNKPPFLRGIYFTSALQQGVVLDEALAQAVGMSVDEYEKQNLDDDLILARHRSYFLRDFFLEKIFMEKGLVFKATRKVGRISGWKLWVPLGFVSGLVLFGLAGWISGRTTPPEMTAWRFLSKEAYSTENYGFRPMLEPKDDGTWAYAKSPVRAQDMLAKLNELGTVYLNSAPKFGWMFGPATWLDGGFKQNRHGAYRTAVDRIVIAPLLEAAVDRLSKQSEHWDAQGVNAGDAEAIRELVALYGGVGSRDADSSVGSFIQAAGLPYTTNKNREVYSTYIGPTLASVRAAHPDGRIPCLLGETSRRKLEDLVERMLGGGGRSDVGQLLLSYDQAWADIKGAHEDAEFEQVRNLVIQLEQASGRLKLAEPQLRFLLTVVHAGDADASSEGDRTAPRKLAEQLFSEQADAVQALGRDRISRWQDLRSRDESEPAEAKTRRQQLAKVHGSLVPETDIRNHEARANLAREIIKLGQGLPEQMTMSATETLTGRVAVLMEKAKALGMEKEAGLVRSSWAAHFTTSELPKRIGFPLVFDAIRLNKGGVERVLGGEESAAVSLLVLRLTEWSSPAASRLAPLRNVARSLFDFEKLAKAGQPWAGALREWELRLANPDAHDWIDIPSVTVVCPNDRARHIEWTSISGTVVRLLPADQGAEPRFSDNLGNVSPFSRGKFDNWAPVRWYLSQMGGYGFGARHQFNKKDFGIVVTPATLDFPKDASSLPSTSNLTD